MSASFARARVAEVALVLAMASLAGCGLSLDWDPPDPQGGLDAGEPPGLDGGAVDGAVDDGGNDVDATTPPDCEHDADCDDGLFCNGEEHCAGGRCVDGEEPCPDRSACLLRECFEDGRTCGDLVSTCPDGDVCDATGLCVPIPDCARDTDCPDDGDPCTGSFVCVAGACVAVAPPLCGGVRGCVRTECIPFRGCGEVPHSELCPASDALDCTVPTCDPASGACSDVPSNAACEDGVPCTRNVCSPTSSMRDARGCVAMPDHTMCEDGFSCTSGFCAPALSRADARGCVQVPNDELCRVGGSCAERVCVGGAAAGTSGDTSGCGPRFDSAICGPGRICAPGAGSGVCVTMPTSCSSDGVCDDGNPCNGVEACEGSRCVRRTSSCPDSGCLQGWCDTSSGAPTCALRVTASCPGLP